MKYKFIFFLFLISNLTHAQNFGSIGSTWNHCMLPIFESPPLRYDNVKIESISDITFNGLPGNTLKITKSTYYGFPTLDEINIFRDGKKVFYEEEDSLYLLYDFNLGQGDTYHVRYPIKFDTRNIENAEWFEPTMEIHIDSVEFVNVGGTLLKKQFLSTNTSLYVVGNYALEGIGYEYWILPFYKCDHCETYNFTGLIEYKDPNIELQSDDHQCASLSYPNTTSDKLFIYPNPGSEVLNFSGINKERINEISIYSSSGKIIVTRFNNFDNIDISALTSGIYIVSVKEDGRVFNEKLVVVR